MANYRIRVLELGCAEHFPTDFSFDGYYLPGETMWSPFSMTLLQGEGKNILVDCGFDMSNPVKAGIYEASFASNGHGPGEVLETVGLKPDDIDAVIVTHLHWDHAGGTACFPKALFYLQREELDSWSNIVKDPAYTALFLRSFDTNDIAAFRELESEERLILLDGEQDGLFPGINIRVSRFAHSFAHQMVLVEHDAGVHVLAGDVCNRPENLLGTKELPFFIPNPKFAVGAPVNAVQDYMRIMKWVDSDVDRVVMAHDGTRNGRYPETKTGLGLSVYEICP